MEYGLKEYLWGGGACSLGASMVKNLPANVGDTDSTPDFGWSHMPQSNYAHEPQLLSLCFRAQELQLLSITAATTEACAL